MAHLQGWARPDPARGNNRPPTLWDGSVSGRGRVPWIEATDAEGFEVFGVPRRDDHLCRLRDGGDEGVVERRVLGDPTGREKSGGRQVERQHPAGERGQDVLLEPAT